MILHIRLTLYYHTLNAKQLVSIHHSVHVLIRLYLYMTNIKWQTRLSMNLRKANNKFISTKHFSFNHKYIPVYMTPCQTLSGETGDIYCAIPGACLWLVGINKLLSQPGNDARREPMLFDTLSFIMIVQCGVIKRLSISSTSITIDNASLAQEDI